MLNLVKTKKGSLTLVFIYYVISFYLAYIFTKTIDLNGWSLLMVWHITATIIIFLFSKVHNNSSIYDPFWHVAPIPIVFYIASHSSLSIFQQSLVLSAFLFWALRLTYNWFLNWTNLDHEDFRYIDLKNNNKLLAFVSDLFGIHLIPTLIVNASLYPIYIALTSDNLNNLVYVGFNMHVNKPILETMVFDLFKDFIASLIILI